MNLTKKLPLIIVIVLIGISLFGFFEERALHFVSDVYQKNLKMLAFVSEIKIVTAGLGSINVPLISGAINDIHLTLTKAQNYLLITDVITFFQVLLISISKSWILKALTLILFALSFPKKTKGICSKLLILSLALNPGLSMFSVGVQQLSQEASIDFGDKYIQKLEVSVQEIKAEHSDLMKQHAINLTKINNGQKGIHFFKKLKENISYDFKVAKNKIKGEHAKIRLFLKEGAHKMTSKIFGFCSMVLFCMVLLPMGYVLILYILFNSLFKVNTMSLAGIPQDAIKEELKSVQKLSFRKKFSNVFKAYKEEFHSAAKEIENENPIQKVKSEIESIESNVVSKVKNTVTNEAEQIQSKIKDEVSQVKGKVEATVEQEENKVTEKVEKVENEAKSKVSEAISTAKDELSKKEDDTPPSVLSI